MAVPTVPEITVTDNADGTATVTVASSSATSNNIAFVTSFNGFTGTAAWSNEGNRTGDGVITVSGLQAGFYWFYVTSTLDGNRESSTPYKLKVTTGEDAVYKQIIDSVHSTIAGLELSGVSESNILICKLPSIDDKGFIDGDPPYILITPSVEAYTGTGSTNASDIVYEVPVAIFAQDDRDQTANIELFLKWREEIRRTFHNKTLTGISSSFAVQHQVTVDPLYSFDPTAWNETGVWFSPMALKIKMREQAA